MKIAFASDLHFEFHRQDPFWLPPLPTGADILILAGDIDVGDDAIKSVRRIASTLPNTDIIYIAGNHEFYNCRIDEQIQSFRESFSEDTNIHFLENDSVTVNGITFLGCTLWTGFDALSEYPIKQSMTEAEAGISDFYLIRTVHSDGRTDVFRSQDARSRYLKSKNWLEQELKHCDPQNTVVVTHFPPHPHLQHRRIPKDIYSNYFISNCVDLIENYQPRAWIYGHNHWSDRVTIGKTVITSNQLGYPQEVNSLPKFDSNKNPLIL